MTSGILQDSLPVAGAPPTSSPRFRPYASPNHHVIKSRYITSNDPRGYIPVYEYPLNGQWIMMDVDDGYILWTGIWKEHGLHVCGMPSADIVKMIESQPDLASQIRRVRGGYLKIQGTWMPYEVALRLSRRVAWPIRHDLVPLFGYAILKQHSVCSSESFDNLLVPHFPPPACLQNNPDMGRSLPTAAVAVEPGGATMHKAQ
ncbi:transcription regulator HTH, apses-type DNA-binding domain-containing protein [Lactarius quietus]|nr:transcription regulator HTH, apses-type DNA-binding domain-containing protein [Lactarius quietus]